MFNFIFREEYIVLVRKGERCCRVRREEERRTKKGEKGVEKEESELLAFRCSKIKINQIDFRGGVRVWLGKTNITPTLPNFLAFTLIYIYIYIYNLCIHTYFSTKIIPCIYTYFSTKIISLCIYIYIYIYLTT